VHTHSETFAIGISGPKKDIIYENLNLPHMRQVRSLMQSKKNVYMYMYSKIIPRIFRMMVIRKRKGRERRVMAVVLLVVEVMCTFYYPRLDAGIFYAINVLVFL
jgi:hypothetical protein